MRARLYALKLAEEMDGKEREEFLAIAELINREEDEFEQRKILNLCDYIKRLGKPSCNQVTSDL